MAKKGGGYGVGKADAALQRMFTNQKANIIATRKLDQRDRMSEYKATQSLTKSLYGNALGTLGGAAKNLTADQARQLRALKRVTSGKAEGRISDRAAETVRNMYGIAGTGYAGPALDTLAAQAKGAKTTLQGQKKAGGILAEANDAAMGTLATGLKESSQGAKAAVANALLYRAKNDASLISQQKTTLAGERIQAAQSERDMRLNAQLQEKAAEQQAQLDFQNWKKQQDYANKQTGGQAGPVTAVAGDAWTGLRAISNQWFDANGQAYKTNELDQSTLGSGHPTTSDGTAVHLLSPGEAASLYASQQGYAAGSPESTVIGATARAMWAAGAGAGKGPFQPNESAQVRSALMSSFATLYPNMQSDKLTNVVDSYVKSLDSGATSNATKSVTPEAQKLLTQNGLKTADVMRALTAAGFTPTEATRYIQTNPKGALGYVNFALNVESGMNGGPAPLFEGGYH